MKKIITIILALIMTLFSAPNQGADQPHVTAEKQPQTAITITVEQVPEEGEMPTVQETVTEECTEVMERNHYRNVKRHRRMHRRRRLKPCGVQTTDRRSA